MTGWLENTGKSTCNDYKDLKPAAPLSGCHARKERQQLIFSLAINGG